MTVNIYDIAPQAEWDWAFENKYINRQVHPTLPFDVLDYSQTAQFDRAWNGATLAARGLIVDRDTLNVVSRPLGKFFNHNEPNSVSEDLFTGPVVVTDKADGSMGVSYRNPVTGALNISTRGSFTSEQAQHATARYLELYDGLWSPDPDFTYVWEIIYPSNRIVLDYGDMDDLILIAKVHTDTGVSVPASAVPEWTWKTVEQFSYGSLAEALESAPRANAEGFVVHYTDTDVRVKIKQDDYVQLHRVITGASSRRIWEMLVAGNDFDSWLRGLPEEFIDYVETTRDDLLAQHRNMRAEVEQAYGYSLERVPENFTQKDFALAVLTYAPSLRGLLFTRHSGGRFNEVGEQKLTDSIWKQIRPEFEKPFWNLNGKTD